MNRPYVYRGRNIPGVYQRCTKACGVDRCDRHKWQYEVELPAGPNGIRDRAVKGGFATARDALDARTEVLPQHKAGTRSLDPTMTLATWLPLGLWPGSIAASCGTARPRTTGIASTGT
jgi:hypothetical protein